MSIDALVTGTVFRKPEQRTSGAGKTYVTSTIRAADGAGESLLVSVVAFSDTAKGSLLAMDAGDALAVSGALKLGTYEARDGSVKPSVSMVVEAVLSTYRVQRKKKAIADAGEKKQPAMAGGMDDSLDDF